MVLSFHPSILDSSRNLVPQLDSYLPRPDTWPTKYLDTLPWVYTHLPPFGSLYYERLDEDKNSQTIGSHIRETRVKVSIWVSLQLIPINVLCLISKGYLMGSHIRETRVKVSIWVSLKLIPINVLCLISKGYSIGSHIRETIDKVASWVSLKLIPINVLCLISKWHLMLLVIPVQDWFEQWPC
jgi:hypothetical protein